MCKLLFSCLFMDFEASQSLHIMSSFSLLCSLFFEDSVTFVLCRLQKHHGQGGAHLKVKICSAKPDNSSGELEMFTCMFWKILMVTKWSWAAIKSSTMTLMRARWPNSWLAKILFLTASAFFFQAGSPWGYCKVTNFRTVFIFVHFVRLKMYEI